MGIMHVILSDKIVHVMLVVFNCALGNRHDGGKQRKSHCYCEADQPA